MKPFLRPLLIAVFFTQPIAGAREAPTAEEVFEYEVSKFDRYLGDDANVGGFIFPSLFVVGTAGGFEPGAGAEDFATNEHDPLNDVGVQAIELDIALQFGEKFDGFVAGLGFLGEDRVWEAELEEAYLHYHINDRLAIGGGQFLNRFGFQSDLHLHAWSFVNHNYMNARLLNEGALITQGGELLFHTPENDGLLTLAAGGVRVHGHDHAHEEEEHGHEEEEHDHLEVDGAGFNDHVFTADYRFRLPFDDSVTASFSVATGENGWGEDTHAYGVGLRKVWHGHDHGRGGPDFCTGATMLQSEFIGRDVAGYSEDGDRIDFDDYGISTSILHQLTDTTTLSLRHDWISGVAMAELDDRHRISPALTHSFGPGDRVRARIQYDYVHSNTDVVGSEHVAWFQIQLQWGNMKTCPSGHAGHVH